MRLTHILLFLICFVNLFSCNRREVEKEITHSQRAQLTLDSLYSSYSDTNTKLLRENYPFDNQYSPTYLAAESQINVTNQYSYLWPYSGTFSAVNALFQATKDNKYKVILDTKVLPGLEEYFDEKRNPFAYASYINSAAQSDRFYDDNVWLGIDFADVYTITKESKYLDKAKLIWTFVASGIDEKLGGGIYWCEQKKESKNTCSNAPGSVFAFKLFEATKDSLYFYHGKTLYDWTKKQLQDSRDYLYFDNVRLDGKIGEAKYAYNSGQMMQSAALLYKLTQNKEYLMEAQNIAKACFNHFFTDFKGAEGEEFKLLKKGDIWFTAVMLRGFIELYHLDKDPMYIDAFSRNLKYAWMRSRDKKGLFGTDWSGKAKEDKKWLLTQAAMVEMYARIASVE